MSPFWVSTLVSGSVGGLSFEVCVVEAYAVQQIDSSRNSRLWSRTQPEGQAQRYLCLDYNIVALASLGLAADQQ